MKQCCVISIVCPIISLPPRVVNARSGIGDVEYERSAIVFRDRNSSES